MNPLHVRLVAGDGFLVVEIGGELDLATVPSLRERLLGAPDSSIRLLVLDLGDVTFLDSTALGLFVETNQSLAARDQTLVLTNVRPSVGLPIRVTGLDQVLPVTYTDEPTRPWTRPLDAAELLKGFTLSPDEAVAAD